MASAKRKRGRARDDSKRRRTREKEAEVKENKEVQESKDTKKGESKNVDETVVKKEENEDKNDKEEDNNKDKEGEEDGKIKNGDESENSNEDTKDHSEDNEKADTTKSVEDKKDTDDKEDSNEPKEDSKTSENIKGSSEDDNKQDDENDSTPSSAQGIKKSPNIIIYDEVKKDDTGQPAIGEVMNEDLDEEPVDEEEKKRVKFYMFDGHKYSFKEKPSVIEEREKKIQFRVVNNDGKRDSLIILTGLKNIFQKQLPEMPKAYITRLVFDRSHVSIAVVRKPLTVVGGITIKPFESHHFAEIVFCAISSTEQVRGYGAHMMNHLKTFVRGTMDVQYFLTYADNYAIGYFKKQGFTKEITLPKKIWMGYIKDYEGGTLMQCSMLPRIRYLDGPKILSLQRAAILRKIRSIGHSHLIRPGLEHFKEDNPTPMNPVDVPGVKEAGWTKEMDLLAQQPKRSPHYPVMLTLLTEMQNHPSNWPFLQPVSRKEVPDYYEVIEEPMDLSTMEVKLENNAYETFDDFIYDCRLIFNNCRQYNGENTTFYKNANKLEKVLINKLKDFPEYSQYLEELRQDKK